MHGPKELVEKHLEKEIFEERGYPGLWQYKMTRWFLKMKEISCCA
jgi:hypothetical protein